jgi:ADP-ribose pyrophosphatase
MAQKENSRRLIHAGKKFRLEMATLPGPHGTTLERELIVHPGAVVVLAIADDGRVVMIRNNRFSVDKVLLELPAGTLEPPEAPAIAAGRELAEETGYAAAKVEPLCDFYSSPGICTERMFAFLATGLSHVGQDLEDDEQIQVELLTPADVLAKLKSGEIEDGKSIAALLYYHAFVLKLGSAT